MPLEMTLIAGEKEVRRKQAQSQPKSSDILYRKYLGKTY